MSVEMQYRGFESGKICGYRGYGTAAEDIWPWGETVFHVMELFFGVLFTCELIAKLIAQRMKFRKDPWNWCDVVIVGAWLVSAAGSTTFPVDPMLLRLARLARLLRLAKLLKRV